MGFMIFLFLLPHFTKLVDLWDMLVVAITFLALITFTKPIFESFWFSLVGKMAIALVAGFGFSAGRGSIGRDKKKTGQKCKKCGTPLDLFDDLVPETSELVCPKCGHVQKKKQEEKKRRKTKRGRR